jgi:hypothetical protein
MSYTTWDYGFKPSNKRNRNVSTKDAVKRACLRRRGKMDPVELYDVDTALSLSGLTK